MLGFLKKLFTSDPASSASVDLADLTARMRLAKLEWQKPLFELASIYGVSNYTEYDQVIWLPESDALFGVPLTFYHHYRLAQKHQLPQCYYADFKSPAGARKNFKFIREKIEVMLGSGVDASTSNCLTRRWDCAPFSIEVMVWPPELNSKYKNVLNQKDPSRIGMALIKVSVVEPQLVEDPALQMVLKLPEKDQVSLESKFDRHLGWITGEKNWDVARNPKTLNEYIQPGSHLAWRDGTSGKFGLSSRKFSFIFDKTEAKALAFFIADPARGSGYSTLSVLLGTAEEGNVSRVTIAAGDSNEDLLAPAKFLAEFWGIDFVREEGLDD